MFNLIFFQSVPITQLGKAIGHYWWNRNYMQTHWNFPSHRMRKHKSRITCAKEGPCVLSAIDFSSLDWVLIAPVCPLISEKVYSLLSSKSSSLLCCPLFLGKISIDATLQEFLGIRDLLIIYDLRTYQLKSHGRKWDSITLKENQVLLSCRSEAWHSKTASFSVQILLCHSKNKVKIAHQKFDSIFLHYSKEEMPLSYLRRKSRGCPSRFDLLSHQAALLATCLGLPQRSPAASPPCTRTCPTSSCRDTAPQPPSTELGIKNMCQPLQEFFCCVYAITWFQYQS